MSTTLHLTGDNISETWSATNKSDSWGTTAPDGGSITRKLGYPSVAPGTAETVLYTSNGADVNIHMGTWVTDVGIPESVVLLNGSSFGINELHGYETAGQLNALIWFKISVVTESGGVLTYSRTLIPWTVCTNEGTPKELGNVIGSAGPMGGYVANGSVNFIQMTSGDTLAVGERLAIEIGIVIDGRSGDSVAIEYGALHNDDRDISLLPTDLGAGKHGSAIVCPINFSEEFQDIWSEHSELDIPWVPGTDIISWADIGGDWTSAKWEVTGASRRFSRGDGGDITAQIWIFQDDDYLYVATNNRIDGCIQVSDHHEIFLCNGAGWESSLVTDSDCLLFRRIITAGTSFTREPVYPILNTKASDRGEYVLQGSGVNVFPRQWEIPTYDSPSKTHTFASNLNTFIEGTDFRMGGPGATSTAPHPNGPGGSYSEFKILKSKIGNWSGYEQLGIMVNFQCDIQGNGHTMFPTSLGNQIDKLDWFFSGGLYEIGDKATSSGAVTVETMDTRPLMMGHGHSDTIATGLSVTSYRWRNDDGSEAAATWISAVNSIYQIDIIDNVDDTIRLRINIAEENGVAAANQGYAIECRVAGGAWFRLDRGTPQYFTIDDSTYLTDGADTTEQLAGAGTFIGTGGQDETGVIASIVIPGNYDLEIECVIKVIANDLAHANSCEFRVVADGVDSVTMAQTPVLLIKKLAVIPLDWEYTVADDGVRWDQGGWTAFAPDATETKSSPFIYPLDMVPANFESISSLTWKLIYKLANVWEDDSYALEIRLISGSTILAAADASGTFSVVDAAVTNDIQIITDDIDFAYINNGATHQEWATPTVEWRQIHSSSKGSDGNYIEVDWIDIDGYYNEGADIHVYPSGVGSNSTAGSARLPNGQLAQSATNSVTGETSVRGNLPNLPVVGNLIVALVSKVHHLSATPEAPYTGWLSFRINAQNGDQGYQVVYYKIVNNPADDQVAWFRFNETTDGAVAMAEYYWFGPIPNINTEPLALIRTIDVTNFATPVSVQSSSIQRIHDKHSFQLAFHTSSNIPQSSIGESVGGDWSEDTLFEDVTNSPIGGKISSRLNAVGDLEAVHTDSGTGAIMLGCLMTIYDNSHIGSILRATMIGSGYSRNYVGISLQNEVPGSIAVMCIQMQYTYNEILYVPAGWKRITEVDGLGGSGGAWWWKVVGENEVGGQILLKYSDYTMGALAVYRWDGSAPRVSINDAVPDPVEPVNIKVSGAITPYTADNLTVAFFSTLYAQTNFYDQSITPDMWDMVLNWQDVFWAGAKLTHVYGETGLLEATYHDTEGGGGIYGAIVSFDMDGEGVSSVNAQAEVGNVVASTEDPGVLDTSPLYFRMLMNRDRK